MSNVPITAPAKSPFASKTLWVNLILMVSLIVQGQFGFVIDAEEQAAVIIVLNMFLRAITRTGLTA